MILIMEKKRTGRNKNSHCKNDKQSFGVKLYNKIQVEDVLFSLLLAKSNC